MNHHYVYTMARDSRNRHIGSTSALNLLGCKHSSNLAVGATNDIRGAIIRKKKWNRWRPRHKLALIENANTEWVDLASTWQTDKQFRPFGFNQTDTELARIGHFPSEDRNPCQ